MAVKRGELLRPRVEEVLWHIFGEISKNGVKIQLEGEGLLAMILVDWLVTGLRVSNRVRIEEVDANMVIEVS